ncbi:amino acid adenylation domain-containing protein [Dactylosporangium sp. NPDC051541]|uniref:amino acid adenylation domain-containing protein n=1 Tax=Dactylosporangium sp. NPDC051541 TaxID=3363977 RepID=UPI0037972085
MIEAPLSYSQERLWFAELLQPGDASENVHVVYRLRGPLDTGLAATAIGLIVERHAVLRTRFEERDGEPVQIVEPPAGLPVAFPDTSAAPDPAAAAKDLVTALVNEPFDLAVAPLVRAAVIRLGPDDHVLCVVLHHLVGDGGSRGRIVAEFGAAYAALAAGAPVVLPELPVQYHEFTTRQRARGDLGIDNLDYWRDRLAGAPPLTLPLDRVRPEVALSGGDGVLFHLDPDLAAAFERLAQAERCTLFMAMLAAFQVVLGDFAGQDDISVGAAVERRPRVELEPLIGFFINIVVLRGDLSGDPTFRELLGRAREACLGAYAHIDVPYERLISDPDVARGSRAALFDVMLVLHNEDDIDQQIVPGLHSEHFDTGFQHAKIDMSLDVWRSASGLRLMLQYDTDLFDRATAELMAARLARLLEAATARPDAPLSTLDTSTDGDRERLLELGCGPAAGTAPDLVTAVREQARRAPDAIAVSCGTGRITYRELDARAEHIAGRLRAAGVGPGAVVGVGLERGPDLIATFVAAGRCGAAYLPLDPAYPAARREYMVADSRATHVVTGPADLDGGETAALEAGAPEAGELAYVIYTSGSTGQPKGVAVPHGAVAARVAWMRERYRIGPGDRVVQFAATSFDTHVEEVWPALTAGAELVLLPPGEHLPDLLKAEPGITVLDLPTAYWHELVADGIDWPPALRLLILGAEQVRPDAVARWRDQLPDAIELVNTYGPTETTVIATTATLGAADIDRRPPIGRPLADTSVYVLDDRLRLAGPGMPGELCIAGAGLARGYLHRPAATAERFVPDPFGPPGSRMYRTGDRVRWRPDGQLEFLGRADEQVKVRGYRVEPGEVETRLVAHPQVEQALVVVPPGGHELVAYVVGSGIDVAALRPFAAETLPRWMVPAQIVVLDRIPLTPGGKVDRRALPAPDRVQHGFVAPRTSAEELVAAVWCDVLGLDRAGAHDDFFEVGGHSLFATKVAARLRAAVGVEVPIRMIFSHTTLEELAILVEDLLVADIDLLSDDEAAALLSADGAA